MTDIRMKIENYKNIENIEQEYKNCRVLLVTADNEKGKSSLIRGFIENITARATTPDPVTHGKADGSKTFSVPDKEGNACTIVHNFSQENKKGTFYAIDHTGKKVKDVTKIRELIGVFEEITLEQFYELQKSAEGRRKIIKNYFYPLLTNEQKEEVIEIDRSTSKGGVDYDKRTEINSLISHLQSKLSSNSLTNEEKILIEEQEDITKEYESLQSKLSSIEAVKVQRDNITEKLQEIKTELETIPEQLLTINNNRITTVNANNEEIRQLEDKIVALRNNNLKAENTARDLLQNIGIRERQLIEKKVNLEESVSKLPDDDKISSIKEKAKKAQEYRDMAIAAALKTQSYQKERKELEQKVNELDKLEKKISDSRKRKEEILKSSNLPSGLKINEDNFTWNGFEFTGEQISESSAMLVIAEILCNIIEAKIVYIGNRSLFNTERFNQLVKIAEKHGKIPVLEQVIDNQNEIKVITEIYE